MSIFTTCFRSNKKPTSKVSPTPESNSSTKSQTSIGLQTTLHFDDVHNLMIFQNSSLLGDSILPGGSNPNEIDSQDNISNRDLRRKSMPVKFKISKVYPSANKLLSIPEIHRDRKPSIFKFYNDQRKKSVQFNENIYENKVPQSSSIRNSTKSMTNSLRPPSTRKRPSTRKSSYQERSSQISTNSKSNINSSNLLNLHNFSEKSSGRSTHLSVVDSTVRSRQNTTSNVKKDAALANELLYKMMPKSVVENLKSKQQVLPQHYDSVTVFFSDIVSFTRLSNESDPAEILQMLDDLYTIFDDILDNYDAYKVETVGDAYMVFLRGVSKFSFYLLFFFCRQSHSKKRTQNNQPQIITIISQRLKYLNFLVCNPNHHQLSQNISNIHFRDRQFKIFNQSIDKITDVIHGQLSVNC